MKKIAYIYRIQHRANFAGNMVANGFKRAFIDQGYQFQEYDLSAFKNIFSKNQEARKLLTYDPDMLFTSVDNVKYLPLNEMNELKLVLWGQYYKKNEFEKDTTTISELDKKMLKRIRDKHDILIWSQHSNEINEDYFSGYKNELGLKFIQLLHCADRTNEVQINNIKKYDFAWVGKIQHRKQAYNEFIAPIKILSNKYLEYTENNPINPTMEILSNIYQSAVVCPNVHSSAQRNYKLLLNDRTFVIPMLGGFEICDNELGRSYFAEDELAIASTPTDFIELYKYYVRYPEKTIPMIEKLRNNILINHTYHNRIKEIFQQYTRVF